jgi:preprotein translocase subunit SecF
MQLFPIGKVYDFMGHRVLWGLISLAMVLASIAGIFAPGPVWGTDFKGGTEVELMFKSEVSEEQIRDAAAAAGFAAPDVIRVRDENSPNRFLIRVQEVSAINETAQAQIEKALCFGDSLDTAVCPETKQASEVKFSPGGEKITVRFRGTPDVAWIRSQFDKGLGGVSLRAGGNNPSLQNERENRVEILLQSKGDQLMSGLAQALGPEVVPEKPLRVEWVGPKAGAQLRDSAVKSILVAVIFVMIYIAFRFELRYAPGAVVSLLHDSVITMGVLIFLGKEFNLTTVAALLTIVGYSVNDTVVVYDRIRENLGKHRGASFIKIINLSLSEMFSRTILTSLTVMINVCAFFVWGTGTLKDFAFTLMVGLSLGTYSSIYVALPFTYWLERMVYAKMGPKKQAPAGPRPKKAAAVI